MTQHGFHRLAAWALPLAFLTGAPAIARPTLDPIAPMAAIDANVTVTYSLFSANHISWVTCGSTLQSEGCYGSGGITGFNHLCAMLEGNSTTNGDTVTRPIYILDGGNLTNPTVTLNVYQKTLVITDSDITTTITLYNTIKLPLQSSATETCSMAANSGFIFAGTSASTQAAKVDLTDYTTVAIGGFPSNLPVTAITANNAGYVIVTYGEGRTPGASGFYVYGPDGANLESGYGGLFLGNSINAVEPR